MSGQRCTWPHRLAASSVLIGVRKEATHPLYERQRLLPGGEANPERTCWPEHQREILSAYHAPPDPADVRGPADPPRKLSP